MSDYREVTSIALYDTASIICNRNYESTFHEYSTEVFIVDGFDLSLLLEKLGMDYKPIKNDEFEIIRRKVYIYGSDFHSGAITKVLAKVEAPYLLSIKVYVKWGDREDIVIDEITYCGRFLVEWLSSEWQSNP